MLMQDGQMAQILGKASCHQFHNPGPLPHGRHQIALPSHGGIELNIVPALILVLEESRVQKNVRPGGFHPQRVLLASQLPHHHFGNLRQVRKLPELRIAGVVVRRKNLRSIDRLQAEMAKDAGKVYTRGVANLRPPSAAHCVVKMRSPEIQDSLFGNTIQLLKIIRGHIRNPRPWVPRTLCLFILCSYWAWQCPIGRRIQLGTLSSSYKPVLSMKTNPLASWKPGVGSTRSNAH